MHTMQNVIVDTDLLIVGAGPCGIGAARRCEELKKAGFPHVSQWLLVEQAAKVGGYASSFTDTQGFTWDIGGHVIYSHYAYFDKFLQETLGDEVVLNPRKGWVWLNDRYIPAPVQHNLQRLPQEQLLACLNTLPKEACKAEINNFREWLISHFGEELCRLFFFPYNLKMWAYDLSKMGVEWTARKSGSGYTNVPLVQLDKLNDNIIYQHDSPGWKDASNFPYPITGGAGTLWSKAAKCLPQNNVILNRALVSLQTKEKLAHFSTGEIIRYKHLITSIPLPTLIATLDLPLRENIPQLSLKHTSSYFFGIGVKGALPEVLKDKYWIHVSDLSIPFFRASVLSKYSKFNAPQEEEHWSILCEVSTSDFYTMDKLALPRQVEEGLVKMGILDENSHIVSRWHHHIECGYPIPSLDRDNLLALTDRLLNDNNIYSRGRFGAWKYEVSNQDNTFMQGVEAVDNILMGIEEITYRFPEIACKNVVQRILPNYFKQK